MADFEELSFVIPGHTPETMPLNRLLEYLQQMSAILGEVENLHLIRVQKSSCAPVFLADRETGAKVRANARRVSIGDGTKKQMDALNSVRRMLRRDAVRDRPAVLTAANNNVLLSIEAAPAELTISGVRQASSVDGALIKIGGAADNASIQLQDIQGNILSGFTAKRALAKELAHLMWEPVRLFGVAQWCRSEDGHWQLERMQVNSFEPLQDESLEMTLAKLRAAPVSWPDDALERLRHERDGDL